VSFGVVTLVWTPSHVTWHFFQNTSFVQAINSSKQKIIVHKRPRKCHVTLWLTPSIPNVLFDHIDANPPEYPVLFEWPLTLRLCVRVCTCARVMIGLSARDNDKNVFFFSFWSKMINKQPKKPVNLHVRAQIDMPFIRANTFLRFVLRVVLQTLQYPRFVKQNKC